MKAMEQSDQPQYLQTKQYNKDEQLKLFVLKHAAKAWTKKTKQPTGPRLNLKPGLSARNALAATCYFLRVIDLEKTSSATNSFRMRKEARRDKHLAEISRRQIAWTKFRHARSVSS